MTLWSFQHLQQCFGFPKVLSKQRKFKLSLKGKSEIWLVTLFMKKCVIYLLQKKKNVIQNHRNSDFCVLSFWVIWVGVNTPHRTSEEIHLIKLKTPFSKMESYGSLKVLTECKFLLRQEPSVLTSFNIYMHAWQTYCLIYIVEWMSRWMNKWVNEWINESMQKKNAL